MKKKHSAVRSRLILAAILIVILLFLFNPNWIPFLSAETRTEVSNLLQSTFLQTDAADGYPLFSWPKIITILAIVALIWLIATVLKLILGVIYKKQERRRTVTELLLSLIKYAAVLVGVIWALTVAGVNIVGLLAGVGVIGLALTFGAQSLLEDVITGIFIIFEGQYKVGDIIVLDSFRGVVKHISVRTTTIEDAGGNLKIINNSDIRNLQNRSANASVVICDLGVPYEARITDVELVLKRELPKILNRNPELFTEAPYYAGVQELGASAVIVRVLAKVEERNIFVAQRALNRELKIICEQNNINIPYQQIVLHQGDGDKNA